MSLLRRYRTPALSPSKTRSLRDDASARLGVAIDAVTTEYCFYVDSTRPLDDAEERLLRWLLSETYEPDQFGASTFLAGPGQVFEVGPRMSFTTAWSTNAVAVCQACGLDSVRRLERSRRYLVESGHVLDAERVSQLLSLLHDRMTEVSYPEPLRTFAVSIEPEPVTTVPVLKEGRAALERLDRELGLAFDDWDLDHYTRLFRDVLGRDPTTVECFDIAQSNSEHSRHWFFRGRLVVDGREVGHTLMDLIREPLRRNPSNSTIAFKDNSSAIRGRTIQTVVPESPGAPSRMQSASRDYDVIFTAETHNFPSGVAPFPGAETGTGGRIRDTHATGRGSLVVAGTAAYCVGNLRIPGYEQPWEDASFAYPSNLAPPLQIEIEASNGASDYGNKFGEPVIQGYTRSFGMRLPDGERREWLKPIMFSAGVGQIDASHRDKHAPEPAMLVVKLGGPAYRIGMGGGAASSMIQGDNDAELDFNAVQRGDAEMEQKLNRVIRSCVELGDRNPIISIHDQGAGGSCNVLKELVDPAGARLEVRSFLVGDDTLSVLEIWGAEYQEQDALLVRPNDEALFRSLCVREKISAAFVGVVTGDGRVVLHDEHDGSTPVDLDLELVLGDMPQKTFEMATVARERRRLELPAGLTVRAALDRVLRLVSVGSKRFLTNKVDRCVTGLVAQQPCVGPLQHTVADVAVIAQSYLEISGAAIAIGEQPIKGLVDPAAMARMSVGEALTNLVWAPISALGDVKCSGNWMWAAKLEGEGADLYHAAVALSDILIALGIAIDGGKDSLSMAAVAPADDGTEVVKCPGALVISAYATCPDVTKTVTPDLELPGRGRLLWVDLSGGERRLGGSALAQVFSQVGDVVPDVDDPAALKRAFEVTQTLIASQAITAGHDVSDGGLVTTLLEMAFAGNVGIDVELASGGGDAIALLFAEELGLVLEVEPEREADLLDAYRRAEVPCVAIGSTTLERRVRVRVDGVEVLADELVPLMLLWEETSHQLDRLQADPSCVDQERQGLATRSGPRYELSYTPVLTAPAILEAADQPRVAIIREEGSNGDREMVAAFLAAGCEPWDVTMSDLVSGRIDLERFRGAVFVGGFSYADVLESAKGWAGVIRFNDELRTAFDRFFERADTFSLGVCNGCQLMALLGRLPWPEIDDRAQPRFIHNVSGRFESRFSTVRIDPSPSIMLRGMEGSSLGVWVAHGEGRALFPDQGVLDDVLRRGLAPVRYVDDGNEVTDIYPMNPNGSTAGVAGLCSLDGRHLAMMPHPERTAIKWQWPWMPREWKRDLEASPWLRMFQNARDWCEESR